MSNAKSWSNHQFIVHQDRKESRSIYLTIRDWDFLDKVGKGSPTKAIRELITIRRENDPQG